jgi:hypothetical protein
MDGFPDRIASSVKIIRKECDAHDEPVTYQQKKSPSASCANPASTMSSQCLVQQGDGKAAVSQ